MPFVLDGNCVSLRGTITILSANNLAAQLVGGYKALQSAFRKCRYCMAVDDDMQTKVCCVYYLYVLGMSILNLVLGD